MVHASGRGSLQVTKPARVSAVCVVAGELAHPAAIATPSQTVTDKAILGFTTSFKMPAIVKSITASS